MTNASSLNGLDFLLKMHGVSISEKDLIPFENLCTWVRQRVELKQQIDELAAQKDALHDLRPKPPHAVEDYREWVLYIKRAEQIDGEFEALKKQINQLRARLDAVIDREIIRQLPTHVWFKVDDFAVSVDYEYTSSVVLLVKWGEHQQHMFRHRQSN